MRDEREMFIKGEMKERNRTGKGDRILGRMREDINRIRKGDKAIKVITSKTTTTTIIFPFH